MSLRMILKDCQRKPTTTGDRCGSTPVACSPAGSGRFSDHDFSNLNNSSMIGYATSGTIHWWKTHIIYDSRTEILYAGG